LITQENRWANDIDGSALAAQPGKSQGRPLKRPGSKPIVQTGLPSLRSPRRPLVPVGRTYVDDRTTLSLQSAVSCPEPRWSGPTPDRRSLREGGAEALGDAPGTGVVEIVNHRDDLGLMQWLDAPIFAGAQHGDPFRRT